MTNVAAATARSLWRNVALVSLAVLLVFSLVLSPFATLPVQAASGWKNVGQAGISVGSVRYTSLVFDPSGTPYVAYSDAGDSGKITVQKFSDGSWQTVGQAGFSPGIARYISLAFNPSGTLYVAYKDFGNAAKITVEKFSDGSWQVLGQAGFSSGGGVSDTSLAFDASGTPYVAYRDYDQGFKATVQKFSGGSWQTVGTAGFSSGGTSDVSLAFGANDTPYVAYAGGSNHPEVKATVEKFSDGSWQTVGQAGFSGDVISTSDVSLAFDSNGTPYVAYQNYNHVFKSTVQKFSSGSWQIVDTAGVSADATSSISVAIDTNDTPYVAYRDYADDRKVTVKKYDGSSWVMVGNAGVSVGGSTFPYEVSLAFDASNTPYVAYGDGAKNGKLTIMKYDPVPFIDSLTPSDDATTADYDVDNFVMTFDMPVTVGSGDITIKQSTDNSVVETIDVTSDQVTGGGTATITLDPSAELTKDTGYYVQVDSTAFVGPTGIKFAGIADSTTWNFATAPNAAPTVAITAPTGGASLPEDQAFTITADAADTDGTVTGVEFFVGSTSLGTDTTAPYSASTTVTDPSTVSLTAVATDNNGDTTTSSAVLATITDETVPAVQSLTPADNTIDVAIDTDFSLTFDEPVNWNTGDILIKKASDDSVVQTIAAGSAATTGDETDTLTVALPDDLAYGTQYYIEVPTTAIGDLVGNDEFAGISGSATWDFTTMDNDGVATSEEAAAPNDGDANNDGRPDSTQANVAAFKSPLTGNYVVLTVDDTCQIESTSLQTEAVQADADDRYKYPFGLLNFTASCGDTPGFTTTITQHYYQSTGEDLVLRKVMDGAYSTVDNATITTKTIGGDSAVVVSYQVTDGGALDADGQANGTIVDPVGLGADTTIAGAPDTGLQSKNMAIFGMAILAGAGLLVGVVTPLRRKVYRVFKETA